ncbi:MAG: hypothetical protein J5846_09760 [Desulfovibrio sp.]|nr:hypothetical protein [Desulfovibrio sp.]
MQNLPQLVFDRESQQRREYAKMALSLFTFLKTSITTLHGPSYPLEIDDETAKGLEDCLCLTENILKIALGFQPLPTKQGS